LEKRLVEKIEQASRLVVRAPCSGVIISRQPELLLGKYLSEGSEVALLGNENSKELRLAVDQDDSDAFFAQVGKSVWIRVGSQVFSNAISQIEPRASLEPLHQAFAASKGGPLSVRRKSKDPSEGKGDSGPESYELLTPQFRAEVKLSTDQSALLAAGQRAQVSFTLQGQSIGDFLFNRFQRWCRDTIRRMRNTWS
jgi:hypothetical protein